MKKFITLIAILAIAGTASADLLDGDFQNGSLAANVSGAIVGDNHLNIGWVNNQQFAIMTNGANIYIDNGWTSWTQPNALASQYSFGQCWSDSGLGATDVVKFDVVDEAYLSSVPDPKIFVEVFGAASAPTWEKLRVSNSTNYDDGALYVPLLYEDIDVSGGNGSYNTASADLSGYPYYAIRVSGKTSNEAWTGGFVGLDNFTIVPIPEPTLLVLLGLGVLAFIRKR